MQSCHNSSLESVLTTWFCLGPELIIISSLIFIFTHCVTLLFVISQPSNYIRECFLWSSLNETHSFPLVCSCFFLLAWSHAHSIWSFKGWCKWSIWSSRNKKPQRKPFQVLCLLSQAAQLDSWEHHCLDLNNIVLFIEHASVLTCESLTIVASHGSFALNDLSMKHGVFLIPIDNHYYLWTTLTPNVCFHAFRASVCSSAISQCISSVWVEFPHFLCFDLSMQEGWYCWMCWVEKNKKESCLELLYCSLGIDCHKCNLYVNALIEHVWLSNSEY